ncbi:autotransporter outer membrane beta-barrel domain-containing protein [Scandinavium sp. H11S7]|uniref:Autotransporter outer membrane beta-barrel domain-containing protein n=1 Tax=Scandinavium hiltneri TaxID=2926519 RepID=A0ABT2E6U6_9ENTR|nr:autotransporter outer membrane beta-barrel domain-containing protein [Scandinavium hiltneri]MCS2163138.1 autotransporter outer membrane beta-barrel domain-containing protein [Scandinavium hiltneri]
MTWLSPSGNAVVAGSNGIINADGVTVESAAGGLSTSSTGIINFSNGSVHSNGNYNSTVYASGNSQITITNSELSKTGAGWAAINASGGAQVNVTDGSLDAGGSMAIMADGSNTRVSVTATDPAQKVNISSDISAFAGSAISANNGGRVELDGISLTASAAGGLYAYGGGSSILADHSVIDAAGYAGVWVTGGSFTRKAQATVNNSDISANDIGILVQSNSTVASENTAITVAGMSLTQGYGILSQYTGEFSGKNMHIHTLGDNALGIAALDGGTISVDGGEIITEGQGAYGIYADSGMTSFSHVNVNDTEIITQGNNSYGVFSVRHSATRLDNVDITTEGDASLGMGLDATYGATLTANNVNVTTAGEGAYGVYLANAAQFSLNGGSVNSAGANAYGIYSLLGNDQMITQIDVIDASLSTDNASTIYARGGNVNLTLSNSTLSAANNNNVFEFDDYTEGTTTVSAGSAVVNATNNSQLTGDVYINSGEAQLNLSQNSSLQGGVAYNTQNNSALDMSIDADSLWTVTSNSSLRTLSSQGTVAFDHSANSFNTVTVNNFQGGGTLVVNTRLGDDLSPTDKLIIDGGTATGSTALQIVNQGGAGAQTATGIQVVEALNGATTGSDAFSLSAASTGYRASTATISAGAYDYHLSQGGNAGDANSWYLTSEYIVPDPVPDPDPIPDPDPAPDPDPVPDPDPDPDPDPAPDPDPIPDPTPDPDPVPTRHDYRPEVGAYLGNQIAAQTLFNQTFHDRTSGPTSQGVWLRIEGHSTDDLSAAGNQVGMDIDTELVQLGADLLTAQTESGLWKAGIMAGYGHAKTDSSSRVQNKRVSAEGEVDGYSIGVYGTWLGEGAEKGGAYVDSWIQYGWFDNEVTGELAPESYDATNLSASLEAGYAFRPVAGWSLMMQPQLQVIYSDYEADEHRDSTNTLIKTDDGTQLSTRVGVRWFSDAQAQPVKPFVEINWWHYSGDTAIAFNQTRVEYDNATDVAEFKVGLESDLGQNLKVWGHAVASVNMGTENYEDYGGMLGVSYHW